MENQTKRTGTIRSMDATRTVHTTLLVRELDDGSIEYLIGDSSRRRDGWAAVPANVLPEIRWDHHQGADVMKFYTLQASDVVENNEQRDCRRTTPLWKDNEIQFARLLCELVANWDDDTSAKRTIRAVAESMDLDVIDVNELFDRANDVWEASKAEHCPR